MPQYSYRALNKEGKQIRGKVNAANETDLYQQLNKLGMMLVDSKPVKAKTMIIGGGRTIQARDKIQFFVHLEQLQAAGVPLIDSLNDVRDSADDAALRDLTSDIINDVTGGTPLSQAFEKHPKVFGDLYGALIAAGEESGKLTESFQHLVHHVKWEDAIRQRIIKAVRYPIGVLVVITGMLGFMMGVVVPGIVEFLQSNNTALPPVTVALIATSNFVQSYWWAIILVPIILTVGIGSLRASSDKMQFAFSCMALRIPKVGGVTTKIAI